MKKQEKTVLNIYCPSKKYKKELTAKILTIFPTTSALGRAIMYEPEKLFNPEYKYTWK